MKWLVSLIGLFFICEILFAPMLSLHFEPGLGFLIAAEGMALGALAEMARKEIDVSKKKIRVNREIAFAYECLIIASANILAQPHANSILVGVGAVILGCVQTIILWLVFRNPRIMRAVEPPRSAKTLSARAIIGGFIYLIFAVVGAAIYASRSLPRSWALPTEFQWPGIVLLYAALSCMAIGLACDHSRPTVAVYAAAAFVILISILMKVNGNGEWYIVGISIFSFLWLVPNWPNWQLVRIANESGISNNTDIA